MKFLPLITLLAGISAGYAEPADQAPASLPKESAPTEGKQGERNAAHAEKRGKAQRHERPPGRPPFGRELSERERQRLMYFNHLIMEKYDVNKNGHLDPEEMEAMRKDADRFRQERRALILKKYDKNGDGKLDDEEKETMRKEVKAEMEKRLAKREKGGKKPEGKEGRRPDGPPPGKASRPGPGQEGNHRKPGNLHKEEKGPGRPEGPRGDKGPGKGHRGPAPEEIIMMHGHHLMMEKFDKDKDGKLSDEEVKAMCADREEFAKKWEEHKAKRRAEMQARRAEAQARKSKNETGSSQKE